MKYRSVEGFSHQQVEKIGVLLVNLGSPASPSPQDIRAFLKAFLSDSRVIEIPQPIWKIILHAFILPFRPKKLSHAYESIWQADGNPLLSISRKQAGKVQQALSAKHGDKFSVALAMRYGEPELTEAMQSLQQQGATKMIVVPLYPQYSATTTATVFDAVVDELKKWRLLPEMRFINHYHDQPLYIKALANSIEEYWNQNGKPQRLMMSFHGLPKRNLTLGDPYFCECHKTARLLAQELSLDESEYVMTFQSRFGKAEWLQPYTDKTLELLAGEGLESIDVVCPGFAADCLETLEEIAVENKNVFMDAGGKQYRYIPALNDRVDHINMLADVIEKHASGWGELASEDELFLRGKLANIEGAES